MNTYRITLRDKDGEVVWTHEQGAANLRLALEVSAARLGGHAWLGLGAVEATVELITSDQTGGK